MIRVIVEHEGEGQSEFYPLAEIRITRQSYETESEEFAGYVAEMAVDRVNEVSLHTRSLYGFPRTRANVLGLLLAALSRLEQEELELSGDLSTSDLERRQPGALLALQGWESELRHNRPSLRGGQSVEHGGD